MGDYAANAMNTRLTRRDLLRIASLGAGAAAVGGFSGCEKENTGSPISTLSGPATRASNANEEYVWLSANANLSLFTTHDHPALRLAAEELGVKTTIAGPSSVDIAGLISAIEQTTAQRPAGMMLV